VSELYFHRFPLRYCRSTMTSRLLRYLLSVLVALAIVASPALYGTARGANTPRHSSNHLPRKQQRIPNVAKTQAALAASARLSSRCGLERRLRDAKGPSLLSACLFATGRSLAFPGLHCLFRPLRC